MLNRKTAVTLTLASLFVANAAFAVPTLNAEAPEKSVDTCVAEVSSNADYDAAGKVQHNVASKPRSVSGHKISIDTVVFGADGETVIREYTSSCAINKQAEIKFFKIRQTGV